MSGTQTTAYRELARARQAIAAYVHETPLMHSGTLSALAGCRVDLKAELFQKTGSYKPRGMLWALMQLDDAQRRRGVITFSAGNAAQGLAYAAGVVGISATVVMPETASPAKAQATRDYGAEVILHGSASDCLAHCRELARTRGLTFISSYDNDDLMTGHASLGLEILEQAPTADTIFVAIGGGGMAGGIAKARAATGRNLRLVGVEPEGAPAMRRSLDAGRAVALERVETIADGLAAPTAGELCYELVREHFEDVVLVPDARIAEALMLLMSRCKLYAEPAGAAALAGLLACRERLAPGSHVVCVISGGNLDFDRLVRILQAAEA